MSIRSKVLRTRSDSPPLSLSSALNVQERTKRVSETTGDLVEVKATIDGKLVGAAVWHFPVDRTSTGGDPLPGEVEIEEMLAEKERREGRSEWEFEMDKTVDQEFYAGFLKTINEVRKEWSKGAPHWYLVSAANHSSFHSFDEPKTRVCFPYSMMLY